MTVKDQVIELLTPRYCDDCIGEKLNKDRHNMQQQSSFLGLREGFVRELGVCCICDHEKLVVGIDRQFVNA